MKRVRTSLFFMAAVGVLVLCDSAWAFSGSGSGTVPDPYVITTVHQLQEMENDLDAWYELGCDIDASETRHWNDGKGFVPIGNSPNHFMGHFNGNGYTITGLYINRDSMPFLGLFGCNFPESEIKNVGLIDVDITGNYDNYNGRHIGGLIGENFGGVITSCYSTGCVKGFYHVGGLVGWNNRGIISDCYSKASVNGGKEVGGLVGANYGWGDCVITNCYSTGSVSGSSRVGGLVGYNEYYCNGCFWDTKTSGQSSSACGTGKSTAQMMQQATFINWDFDDVWDILENETYPFLRPVLKPIPVAIDIKPGSCPNPLNLASKGILPVAILGSEGFDVSQIDAASVRLAGVAPIRSSYEDVATPAANMNECDCTTEGPDGYTDLTLKFKTQQIVEELVNAQGELADGEVLVLTLTGVLSDQTPIEGADCIVLVGNVPKALAAKRWDYNGDGIVNILDFAELATYWLESTVY